MSHYLTILFSAVLVNNFVLVKFLGLCPFMGTSRRLDTAFGMALATTFVLTLAAVSSWAIEYFLLAPFGLGYLRVLAFILLIAALVQLVELIIQRFSPLLHRVLGLFLPLITSNCAVLGVALLNHRQGFGFLESAVYGLGAALGFALVLILFTGLRERIALSDPPEPFQGTPIAMITAGLLSLSFMGFSGLIPVSLP